MAKKKKKKSKLRILRWGEEPGFPRWALCNHRNPYKREAEGDLNTEVEGSAMAEGRCYPAGFEDGGRSHEPRNARSARSRSWKR